ncbi:hypothetical protein ATY27_09260 [Rheinheimera sp. F8]|nr:hypothetical protein ATY27_09260 [Rheinheimera sp. F8]
MLLNKLNSLNALMLWSLLGHLALTALVLQQQFVYRSPAIPPAPLQVFAVTRLPQRPPPVVPAIQPAAEPAVKPPAPTPAPVQPPVPQKRPEPMRTPAAVSPAKMSPAKISPVKISPAETSPAQTSTAPVPTRAAPADRPLDLSAVFSSVQQQAARRELSAAELAALSAPKTETSPRSVTTAPSSAVRRPAVKPGSGPAGDVLETLANGNQLVRVGKQCVLASPGADLRKDIHSMKLVACGAGGNSEQDKIDAHFEQVMSKIGQHR